MIYFLLFVDTFTSGKSMFFYLILIEKVLYQSLNYKLKIMYFCSHYIYFINLKLLNIKYLSYLLFFIGMYFGGRYAVNGIALFVFIAIISIVKEGIRPIKEFPKILLIPISFYLIHLISALYSTNLNASFFDLQVKFSFVLLPLIFGLQKKEKQADIYIILRLFVLATIISTSVLLGVNYIESIKIGKWQHYMEFSKFLHPSYLSMYLVFFVLTTVFLVSQKKGNLFCLSIGMLLSITTLYFADSKAGMLVLNITLGFIGIKSLYSISKVLALVTSFLVILSVIVLFNYSYRFKTLHLSTEKIEQILDNPNQSAESTTLRILVWSASIEVIKHHPIIGVGNGDVKNELNTVYTQRNYKVPLEIKMNSHNQYLETYIGTGIIGLMILVFMITLPFFIIKSKTLLMQGFIIIFAFNILVESMFNTQAGVIFIVFFYSFLISQTKNKNSINHGSVTLEATD